jgi:hypothetical protein
MHRSELSKRAGGDNVIMSPVARRATAGA